MARYRRGMALLLVFLASAFFGCVSSVSLSDAIDLIRLGRQTSMELLESWEMIAPRLDNIKSGENLVLMKAMERELLRRMDQISRKIDEYQGRTENKVDTILSQLLLQLPMQHRLDNALRELDHYIGQVDGLYRAFEMYANNSDKFEKFTILRFAKTCVSPRLGELPDVLKSIHRLVVPSEQQVYNRSILVLLANQMEEASDQMCNEMQSPQQLLYNLYNAVALTEIKGYTMIQFSYMLLRLYNEGNNFSEEIQTLKHQYAIRTSETLRAVKTAMAFAPRSLWRCDPGVHKLDETYTELTELFQGYIVNEVDLNGDGTCKENCGYYGYSKVHSCYANQFCSKQRQCTGKILQCEYIDSDMWICPTANKNHSRRYEYIEYENGLHYGNAQTCPSQTIKVNSWWRWLFWHCSYCFCYCDDQNSSTHRYFSLRSVMSDISNNRVITGVKLKMVNRVIHIQIQEGQLLPSGEINKATIQWQPIDAFSIKDPDIKSDVDYHAISWEKRALDLDDLSMKDHLLTGLRFRMVGSRLNLEIRVTPFNFTSGSMIQPEEKSFWHSNDVTSRTELKFNEPDVPIRSSLPNVPDSGENQYLNFAPSDRRKDAAQSTIPFLDVQPLTPNPPVPLSGAGIFHKGRTGSGGFIALKLITYNYAPHLQADLPPAPPVLGTAPNEIKAA